MITSGRHVRWIHALSKRSHQTIRAVIEAQRQRLRSNDARVRLLGSFLHSGDIGARIMSMSDRQVGQLVFDYVGGDFCFGSPEAAICAEATERLFRSPSGIRLPDERLNEPGRLPICPRCGAEMMHFIGIDETDYRQCASLKCQHKIQEQR